MSAASTWHDVARALDLTPYRARLGFSKDLTFSQVRALALLQRSAFGAPHVDDWLHGFREGTEVFVVPFTSATSGADWTICIACCEAPEDSMSSSAFDPLLNAKRESLLGLYMPGLEFGTSICQPVRAAARARGADVLVGATLSRSLVARQGRVEDVAMLRADLGGATELAREVGSIHRFIENEWSAFSERQGLFFDQTRSRIEGDLHGARLGVELVAESGKPLRTKVRTAFPERLLAGKASIEDMRAAPMVRKILSHEFALGIPVMNARYNLSGDHVDEVTSMLHRPTWLATLELPGVTRLWIKEHELVWTLTGCPPRAFELDVLAECIRETSGNHAPVGPYR